MKHISLEQEEQFYRVLLDRVKPDGNWLPLSHLLYRAAKLFGKSGGIEFHDEFVNFEQLYARASRFAQTLRERGVKPRDRVLLFVHNSPEFYVGYFAIAQLGAVVAPLNVYLKERELKHIVADAQPTLMIASKELTKQLVDDGIEISFLTEDDMPKQAELDLSKAPDRFLDPDEMAVLLYTSGTTGLPKGVMLSTHNIMSNLAQGISRIGIDQQARVLGVLPLFHSFAQITCVWGSILMGCIVIIVPKIERRYILEGLSKHPNFFLGVPALYGLLCLFKTANLSGIEAFICGGDALPDKIRAAFALIYNRRLCVGYGLTETSPVLTANFEDAMLPANNVGRPLINVQIEIRSGQGQILPALTVGQIWTKGPMVMLGYYNEPERTAETIHDGWLDTGDLGYLDEQGRLVITGRHKDLIISKGFNIYPQEIENVILMHPSAIRAGVIGIPDQMSGEVPIAYVQIAKGEENIEQILKQLCMNELASYKVPRQFIVSTHALPLTATGKVDKKELRKKHQ